MADIRLKLSSRVPSPLTIMSTELNSLAASTGTATSPAITQGSDLDLFMDLELHVVFNTNPTDQQLIECYLIRSVDSGGTYEDGSSSSIVPRQGFVGAWSVRATSGDQIMIIPGIVVPPTNFKVMIVNKTGAQLRTTGSTIRGLFYKYQTP